MADWKETSTEKLDPAFAAIRSLFLDGTIDKMYKLINHNPTKVAQLFSMSYKTFHEKLREPWRFSVLHIMLLANVLKIDPEVINGVIQKEVGTELNKKLEAYNAKIKASKQKSVKKP